jgi:hypothetical protein
MASHDLYHDCQVTSAFNSATIGSDTTTNGVIVDTAGFEALTFSVQSGAITDGAYTVTMAHSDASDLSGSEAVPADEVLGSIAFALAEDNVAKRIGYIGKKRYVRISIVSTGTTSGGVFSATAIKSVPHSAPVANQ